MPRDTSDKRAAILAALSEPTTWKGLRAALPDITVHQLRYLLTAMEAHGVLHSDLLQNGTRSYQLGIGSIHKDRARDFVVRRQKTTRGTAIVRFGDRCQHSHGLYTHNGVSRGFSPLARGDV